MGRKLLRVDKGLLLALRIYLDLRVYLYRWEQVEFQGHDLRVRVKRGVDGGNS
jgi:hypothetical protein